jgi:pyruvate dehydrogenase E2 component (dihydrolipoamide acetyltransferase)
MATPVILPKVDMDQETGAIAAWHAGEGDWVEKGKPLLTIETNKVAIEVEAPASGVLHLLNMTVGEVMPIGTLIAQILQPGEALPAENGGAATAAAVTAPPLVMPAQPSAPAVAGNATPVAKRLAADLGVDLGAVAGTGPRGLVTTRDVQAAADTRVPGRVNATPAARRLAREQAVDLAGLAGRGPRGRVQAGDVLAVANARPVDGPSVARAAPAEPPAADEIVPLSGMRRTIAERMLASYQTIPHISFMARVDMTGLNALRAELNAHAAEAGLPKISVTAMLVKAVAHVLLHHPWLNSSLVGDEIRLRKEIHLGVAVALDAGLIVPVVRRADRKGLAALAAEIDDLTARARAGRLTPADVTGGTFTLSNLGPFGVEQFTALINPPQVAILAVGAAQLEAVPQPDGQIAARPIVRLTLSADHRVVDGAVAARFLGDLQRTLTAPTRLLL